VRSWEDGRQYRSRNREGGKEEDGGPEVEGEKLGRWEDGRQYRSRNGEGGKEEDGGPEVEGEKLVRWEAVSKSEWGILEAERGDRKGIKKMGR